MSCAGLMGLAIAASRPSLAERQTARARGAALAADPAFQSRPCAVGQDARRAGDQSDIYYLWSLERVCVALGLRSLDGFDWYGHGARILLDRQESDGGWPHDRWGRLPSTCSGVALSCERPTSHSRSTACCGCPGPGAELALAAPAGRSAAQPEAAAPTSEPQPASAAADSHRTAVQTTSR